MEKITKEDFINSGSGKILALLGSSQKGLSGSDVHGRREVSGFNEIKEYETPGIIILARKFFGLSPGMLEIVIIMSLFMGHFLDAVLIGSLLVMNAFIRYSQEVRSSKVVRALDEKLSVSVRVVRNGSWTTVPSRDIVPGDLIRIRAGDFVPADAKIIKGSVSVDQSALTGESGVVMKKIDAPLFSGSVVKAGECTAVVVFTGRGTYFGKTVALLDSAKPGLKYEKVIRKVTSSLVFIVSLSIVISLAFSYFRGEDIISLLPLAFILLVSAVPVALPVMFTVSMALGSENLSEKGVLVTRLNASEDAASMMTLCLDKTGTITENKLSITDTKASSAFTPKDVWLFGSLASLEADEDPIDIAFIKKWKEEKISEDYIQEDFTPFSPESGKTRAKVYLRGKKIEVSKGSYRVISSECRLSSNEKKSFEETLEDWAKKGYRSVAVSVKKRLKNEFVGLVALYDAPRKDSRDFIDKIKSLGVKVKMLTGDAAPVARDIAKETGILSGSGEVVSLRERKMGQSLSRADVFCEVLPEDKFDIVKSIQTEGETVGMTGDGVNDAPALKEAEVGIAVKNATDIAKKSASVVLVNDSLDGVLSLIKTGREIHMRVSNWITNKIMKTFQVVLFVCLAYMLTGKYIASALDVVLLLIFVDFTTISFSTDNVRVGAKPEIFRIKNTAKVSVLIGFFTLAESLSILYLAQGFFGILSNASELESFGFAVLFFFSILDVLIIREKGHMWESRPGNALLLSVTASSAIVITMLLTGFIITSLPLPIIIFVLGFVIFSILINDFVKVFFFGRAGNQA